MFLLISLVFIVFFSSSLSRVQSNLLVVLFKSRKILSGLRELSLFHTFTHIPVYKGTLGIHEVKLVVKPGPSLGNGSSVAEHTDSSAELGQITSRYYSGGLVVNSYLKASRTPFYKLDALLGLDGGDGSIDVLRNDISSVEKTACHVFSMPWVTFHHLVGGFKASIGDLRDCELLVVGLLRGNDGSISDQGEVDPRIRHQVGLELSQIHIESSIKPKGSSDGGDDLTNKSV